MPVAMIRADSVNGIDTADQLDALRRPAYTWPSMFASMSNGREQRTVDPSELCSPIALLPQSTSATIRMASETVMGLGPMTLRVRSTRHTVPGSELFSRAGRDTNPTAAYEIDLVDLDDVPTLDVSDVLPLVDDTFRSERLRAGYYLTHYFGEPAYLISADNRYLVLGRRLERILWPYLVKYLLTRFSIEQGSLHLKAAAFAFDGMATLLVGRGGGGKSVFLTQACVAGGAFLSNTHVLLSGSQVMGVPTAMRVRDDDCFRPLIHSLDLPRHIVKGEFSLDPVDAFPGRILNSGRLRNLVVVDHQRGADRRLRRLRRLTPDDTYLYAEAFALPIPTYGIKDDVLAYVGGDLDRFVAVYRTMKEQLRQVVDECNCFHTSCDMLDPDERDRVLEVIA